MDVSNIGGSTRFSIDGLFQTHEGRFQTCEVTVPEMYERLTDGGLAMSLVGLTYVFWPEAVSLDRGVEVCRYLRPPITRRRTKGAMLVTRIEVATVADVFSKLNKERMSLARRYVHQLIDASDETIFLETRALSAVVLIERILNDQLDRAISGVTKSALNRLRSSIVSYAKRQPPLERAASELSAAISGNIRDSLARMGEKSFKQSLREYLESAKIAPVEWRTAIVDAVVPARNCLVHEGRFSDGRTFAQQYQILHWIAAAMCMRAIGVTVAVQEIPEQLREILGLNAS